MKFFFNMYPLFQKEKGGFNFRWFINNKSILEIAFNRFYCKFGISVELPTEWHEDKKLTINIGLFWLHVYINLPWFGKIYPDHMQCSGPTYGFNFFEDMLMIFYGQDTGSLKDPKRTKIIYLPNHWKHIEHKILSEPETYEYSYTLKNGNVQHCRATIKIESREWRRNWIPWKKISKYIDVWFSDEVGERAGSWKGGTIGCSYDMLPNETAYDTLKRMEKERKF